MLLNKEYIKPVKGTVSFDDTYSFVTIDIKIPKDESYIPFDGNGKYRMNAND